MPCFVTCGQMHVSPCNVFVSCGRVIMIIYRFLAVTFVAHSDIIIVLLDMKRCIVHFTKLSIHPLISEVWGHYCCSDLLCPV